MHYVIAGSIVLLTVVIISNEIILTFLNDEFLFQNLLVLPFRWNVFDPFYLNGLHEYMQLRKILQNADVIIVGFEGWYNVISRVKNKKIIYDKMDENSLLSNISGNQVYLQKCETRLIKKSIAMFASARMFVNNYKDRLPVYLIPNAFDGIEGTYTVKKQHRRTRKYLVMWELLLNGLIIRQLI